jgi:hypothetical protein
MSQFEIRLNFDKYQPVNNMNLPERFWFQNHSINGKASVGEHTGFFAD